MVLFVLVWQAISQCAGATAASTTSDQPPKTTSVDAQILQAELDVTRRYDDRLLATVHWSLATMAAVANS